MRKIPFALTFEEFCLFDDLHDYVNRVGVGAEFITVDRKDTTLGYFLDNLQILTFSENVRKENFLRQFAKNRKTYAPGKNFQNAGETKHG